MSLHAWKFYICYSDDTHSWVCAVCKLLHTPKCQASNQLMNTAQANQTWHDTVYMTWYCDSMQHCVCAEPYTSCNSVETFCAWRIAQGFPNMRWHKLYIWGTLVLEWMYGGSCWKLVLIKASCRLWLLLWACCGRQSQQRERFKSKA